MESAKDLLYGKKEDEHKKLESAKDLLYQDRLSDPEKYLRNIPDYEPNRQATGAGGLSTDVVRPKDAPPQVADQPPLPAGYKLSQENPDMYNNLMLTHDIAKALEHEIPKVDKFTGVEPTKYNPDGYTNADGTSNRDFERFPLTENEKYFESQKGYQQVSGQALRTATRYGLGLGAFMTSIPSKVLIPELYAENPNSENPGMDVLKADASGVWDMIKNLDKQALYLLGSRFLTPDQMDEPFEMVDKIGQFLGMNPQYAQDFRMAVNAMYEAPESPIFAGQIVGHGGKAIYDKVAPKPVDFQAELKTKVSADKAQLDNINNLQRLYAEDMANPKFTVAEKQSLTKQFQTEMSIIEQSHEVAPYRDIKYETRGQDPLLADPNVPVEPVQVPQKTGEPTFGKEFVDAEVGRFKRPQFSEKTQPVEDIPKSAVEFKPEQKFDREMSVAEINMKTMRELAEDRAKKKANERLGGRQIDAQAENIVVEKGRVNPELVGAKIDGLKYDGEGLTPETIEYLESKNKPVKQTYQFTVEKEGFETTINMPVEGFTEQGLRDEMNSRIDARQKYLDELDEAELDTSFDPVELEKEVETVTLYRGLTTKFDKDFDLSKTDAPQGYSTYTDNPKLAREYAGKDGKVYEIKLPKDELRDELVDADGNRALFLNNKKKAGLNNVSGEEYLVYNDHERYDPKQIREQDPTETPVKTEKVSTPEPHEMTKAEFNEKAPQVESGRTAEDLELKPNFAKKIKAVAVKVGDEIIEAKEGEFNHADIAQRLNFPDNIITGFVDKDGKFLYQYLDDAHRIEVQQAIKDGKKVPADVLKDYPELSDGGRGGEPLPARKPQKPSNISTEAPKITTETTEAGEQVTFGGDKIELPPQAPKRGKKKKAKPSQGDAFSPEKIRFGNMPQDQAGLFDAPKDLVGRARVGGEIGVNGYEYKGGQFLPSTDAPPGTWRVKVKGKSKLMKTGKEEIAPFKFEVQPTPFSRSTYSLISGVTKKDAKGNLVMIEGLKDFTPETTTNPGVAGILSKESFTYQELIDAHNGGAVWLDVKPDVEIIAKGSKTESQKKVTKKHEGMFVESKTVFRDGKMGFTESYELTKDGRELVETMLPMFKAGGNTKNSGVAHETKQGDLEYFSKGFTQANYPFWNGLGLDYKIMAEVAQKMLDGKRVTKKQLNKMIDAGTELRTEIDSKENPPTESNNFDEFGNILPFGLGLATATALGSLADDDTDLLGAGTKLAMASVSGLNKRSVLRKRVEFGMSPMSKTRKVKFQKVLNEVIESGLAGTAMELAESLVKKPRAIETEDYISLMVRGAELEIAFEQHSKDAKEFRDNGNMGSAELSLILAETAKDNLATVYEASKLAGTKTAQSLSIRQYGLNPETNTLANVTIRAENALGRKLPKEKQDKIVESAEKDAKLVKEIEKLTAKWQEANDNFFRVQAELEAEKQINKEKRIKTKDKKLSKIKSQRKKDLDALNALGFQINVNVDPKALYLIGKVAKSYIAEGVTSMPELTAKMLDKLPDLTEGDVWEALTAKDPERVKKQLTKAQSDVKKMEQLAGALVKHEKAVNGIFVIPKDKKIIPPQVQALRKATSKLQRQAFASGLEREKIQRLVEKLRAVEEQLQGMYRSVKKDKRQPDSAEVAGLKKKIQHITREMTVDDMTGDLRRQIETGIIEKKHPRPKVKKPERLDRKEVELTMLRKKRDQFIADMERSTWLKFTHNIVNTNRSLLATADLSATHRQGGILSASNPDLAVKAQYEAVLAGGDVTEFKAELIHKQMTEHPAFYLVQKAGIQITEVGGGMTAGEEKFSGDWINKIPKWMVIAEPIKASERHMVTFLNSIRTDTFYRWLARNPEATDAQMRIWGRMINEFTGRGDLGELSGAFNIMSLGFFAPRFAMSRIQTPLEVFRDWKDPVVMKEKAIAMVSAVAMFMGILYLANEQDGVEVELDPRHSDWAKVRKGTETYDFGHGVVQSMRFALRLIQSQTDRFGATGEDYTIVEKEYDLMQELGWFFNGKKSATLGFLDDALSGENFQGEKVTIPEMLQENLTPIILQTIKESAEKDGWTAPSTIRQGIAEGVGISASNRPDSKKRAKMRYRKWIADGFFSKAYAYRTSWMAETGDYFGKDVKTVDRSDFDYLNKKAEKLYEDDNIVGKSGYRESVKLLRKMYPQYKEDIMTENDLSLKINKKLSKRDK